MSDALPPWPPRGMREDKAAYYVGFSPATLRRIATAEGIRAIHITPHIKVYLREDLDAYLDRKANRTPASERNEWAE